MKEITKENKYEIMYKELVKRIQRERKWAYDGIKTLVDRAGVSDEKKAYAFRDLFAYDSIISNIEYIESEEFWDAREYDMYYSDIEEDEEN